MTEVFYALFLLLLLLSALCRLPVFLRPPPLFSLLPQTLAFPPHFSVCPYPSLLPPPIHPKRMHGYAA